MNYDEKLSNMLDACLVGIQNPSVLRWSKEIITKFVLSERQFYESADGIDYDVVYQFLNELALEIVMCFDYKEIEYSDLDSIDFHTATLLVVSGGDGFDPLIVAKILEVNVPTS